MPATIVYDRTKTVVKRHVAPGKAVPLHPEAAAFAAHYGFEIDVLAAYRPTGKGRCERQVAVTRAIATITEDAWTPVHYPGAVIDPDTGQLISDAEVAEVPFTAFGSTNRPVTARLIVRRVRDRNRLDELLPVWRHHPVFTNNAEPTTQADITHRRHAIIETVFADLIDGPLAHLPSSRFAANSAWSICAALTHNLLRAAGSLASDRHAVARGSTLRRQVVTVPARLARPQCRPVLHLPAHWPWATQWTNLCNAMLATGPPAAA